MNTTDLTTLTDDELNDLRIVAKDNYLAATSDAGRAAAMAELLPIMNEFQNRRAAYYRRLYPHLFTEAS